MKFDLKPKDVPASYYGKGDKFFGLSAPQLGSSAMGADPPRRGKWVCLVVRVHLARANSTEHNTATPVASLGLIKVAIRR